MRKIVEQPNGKYCIFSNIIDNVTHYNMSIDYIIDSIIDEERIKIKNKIINEVYNINFKYEDMIELIKEYHGKQEVEEIEKLINN
jgi:hypothetical protein